MQVDPIKFTLKVPGIGRFTLEYHKPFSSFASNFNLRRYTVVAAAAHGDFSVGSDAATAAGLTLPYLRVMAACGAQARPFTVHDFPCSFPNQITGAKAEAWCLLIHADASLSLSLSKSNQVVLLPYSYLLTLLRSPFQLT